MKHPISYEEARAFAEKYADAPDDVCTAQFVSRCELARARRPEDVRARLETSYRINQAMDRVVARRRAVDQVICDDIEYLDPERRL